MTRTLDNRTIAEKLDSFAVLLELSGAAFYASRAYRGAAETIRESLAPVEALVRSGRIRELKGIGPSIAATLDELVTTGTITELEKLERTVRPDLVGLARYLGVGPGRMLEIAAELDLSSAEELREAALAGRLRQVRGIGPVTERRLLARLQQEHEPRPRRGLTLNRARVLLDGIAVRLGGEVAGDVRRWLDTPHELSVVVAGSRPTEIIDRFERLPEIVSVVERADRRAVGVTVEGAAVVLAVSTPASHGTELLRATGTTAYVAALGPLPDAGDEREVYALMGVPWCPPELRELPFAEEPPDLVDLVDVRGDLHCHTTSSDGRNTVREMAMAAIELGYEYIAICDHTPNVRVVPGLDADALRRQGEEIAAVNEEVAPFRVLRGTEVDIRQSGDLDLPDDVLAELDWVQLSLHAGQRDSREKLTQKVTEAMRHPSVRCLSHPTGRIVNHRAPNALDLERVIEVALETGVALEVNGLPDRLDLNGENARLVVEAGVPLVASTDAHSIRGLGNMQYAIAMARRGWATAANVVNTAAWPAKAT